MTGHESGSPKNKTERKKKNENSFDSKPVCRRARLRFGYSTCTGKTPPKMKMTTDIPAGIAIPDSVETRLGELKLDSDGPGQGLEHALPPLRPARAVV